MSVKLRRVMDLIPIYRPGGCPEEQGGETAVKLSSNECPWQPPAAVIAAITEAATTLNRYPDFYKEALCAKLAEHNGLPAPMVSVDNGSGTILQDIALSCAMRAMKWFSAHRPSQHTTSISSWQAQRPFTFPWMRIIAMTLRAWRKR